MAEPSQCEHHEIGEGPLGGGLGVNEIDASKKHSKYRTFLMEMRTTYSHDVVVRGQETKLTDLPRPRN